MEAIKEDGSTRDKTLSRRELLLLWQQKKAQQMQNLMEESNKPITMRKPGTELSSKPYLGTPMPSAGQRQPFRGNSNTQPKPPTQSHTKERQEAQKRDQPVDSSNSFRRDYLERWRQHRSNEPRSKNPVVFATPQPKRAAEIQNKLKTHLLTSKLKGAEEAEEEGRSEEARRIYRGIRNEKAKYGDALKKCDYWIAYARFEEAMKNYTEVISIFEHASSICTQPFALSNALGLFMVRLAEVSSPERHQKGALSSQPASPEDKGMHSPSPSSTSPSDASPLEWQDAERVFEEVSSPRFLFNTDGVSADMMHRLSCRMSIQDFRRYESLASKLANTITNNKTLHSPKADSVEEFLSSTASSSIESPAFEFNSDDEDLGFTNLDDEVEPRFSTTTIITVEREIEKFEASDDDEEGVEDGADQESATLQDEEEKDEAEEDKATAESANEASGEATEDPLSQIEETTASSPLRQRTPSRYGSNAGASSPYGIAPIPSFRELHKPRGTTPLPRSILSPQAKFFGPPQKIHERTPTAIRTEGSVESEEPEEASVVVGVPSSSTSDSTSANPIGAAAETDEESTLGAPQEDTILAPTDLSLPAFASLVDPMPRTPERSGANELASIPSFRELHQPRGATPVPQSLLSLQPKFFGPPQKVTVPRPSDADEEKEPMGKIVVLTPLHASKKEKSELGSDVVLKPVRRSARLSAAPTAPTPSSAGDISELLEKTSFCYSPNVALLATGESVRPSPLRCRLSSLVERKPTKLALSLPLSDEEAEAEADGADKEESKEEEAEKESETEAGEEEEEEEQDGEEEERPRARKPTRAAKDTKRRQKKRASYGRYETLAAISKERKGKVSLAATPRKRRDMKVAEQEGQEEFLASLMTPVRRSLRLTPAPKTARRRARRGSAQQSEYLLFGEIGL